MATVLLWYQKGIYFVCGKGIVKVMLSLFFLGVFSESLSQYFTVVIPDWMVRDRQKCIFYYKKKLDMTIF